MAFGNGFFGCDGVNEGLGAWDVGGGGVGGFGVLVVGGAGAGGDGCVVFGGFGGAGAVVGGMRVWRRGVGCRRSCVGGAFGDAGAAGKGGGGCGLANGRHFALLSCEDTG